jgi:hypothetical protein
VELIKQEGPRNGLRETVNLRDAKIFCADEKCPRAILPGDSCLFDEDGRIFCEGCGKALRYHRKKAAQRGELYEEED